jgi:hypothetical protein
VTPSAVKVALERAYIETVSTCDAYVTRGEISHQVLPANMQLAPGQPPLNVQGASAIAFEIESDKWERFA